MAKWTKQTNCFGYAVGIPDWLLMENKRLPNRELVEYGLKPVRKSEMVLGKEYVAYRYGKDDFHFMKRTKQGHWRHKQGYKPVTTISQKVVFAKVWHRGKPQEFDYGVYDSKIYLYEVI